MIWAICAVTLACPLGIRFMATKAWISISMSMVALPLQALAIRIHTKAAAFAIFQTRANPIMFGGLASTAGIAWTFNRDWPFYLAATVLQETVATPIATSRMSKNKSKCLRCN